MDTKEMATDLATLDQTNLPTLTAKQMGFVRGMAEGKSISDAYRAAYDTSPNASPNTVWSNASQLRAHTKVSQWLGALKQAGRTAVDRTQEAHLNELENIKAKAIDKDQLSVAARCEELKGKVSGHYIERRAVLHDFGPAYLRAFDAISARASVGVTKGDDAKVIEHEPAG